MRILRGLLASTLLLSTPATSACGRPSGTREASSSRVDPPGSPANGRFAIHEWGLVGVGLSGAGALVASGVAPERAGGSAESGLGHHGFGVGQGGKPVVYVHLAPGTDRAEFALRVGLPGGASVPEHWPAGTLTQGELAFPRVVATRGACAAPTAPPPPASPACVAVPDGFCEAAEIPRYLADSSTCLAVGGANVPLLFYRASGVDASGLPIVLRREAAGLVVRRPRREELRGPILALTREADGEPRILRLDAQAASGPMEQLVGAPLTVEEARAALIAHALAEGLTAAEAEAFVDAWAPAYFDHCRREGPEASGLPPAALAPAAHSLLYFAPRALVDAMLPLSTVPPAAETRRVFLIRVVDHEASLGTLSSPPASGQIGIGTAPQQSGYVRVSDAIVARGELEGAVIRRVVQRNVNQVRYCYEQGLARHPAMQGRYVLRLAIGATGQVSASSLASDTVNDAEVARCVTRASQRWAFPASASGLIADVPMQLQTERP